MTVILSSTHDTKFVVGIRARYKEECKNMLLKNHLVWILFVVSSTLAFTARAEKTHVCSITLNSNDEIELLKRRLDPNFYEFRELVPQNQEGKYVFGWFNTACESNYRCDVLVISGHFGGHFFGETSPYTLDIEQMHRASCQQTCTNILSAPKDVYLLGCNTLASKAKGSDGRDFDSYYNVLLDYGYSNENAFSIAAMRFSPIATTFGEKMRQIFSGKDKRILGFSFVSPLGSTNARLMEASLKNNNDNINSQDFVSDLLNRFQSKNIQMTMTEGISTYEEVHQNNQVCKLNDRVLDVETKFAIIENLLADKNYLQSLPSALFILNAFDDLNPKQFKSNAQRDLQSLKSNPIVREHLESILPELATVPDSQVEVLKTMYRLGWLSEFEMHKYIRDIIHRLNNSRRDLDGDFLCLIRGKNPDLISKIMGPSFVQNHSCNQVSIDFQYYSPAEFFGGVKAWNESAYFKKAYKDRADDLAHEFYQLKFDQTLDSDYLQQMLSRRGDYYINAFHLFEIKVDRVFTDDERSVLSEIPENAKITQWGKAFFLVNLVGNNNFVTDQEMGRWLAAIKGDPEIYKTLRPYLSKIKSRYPSVMEYLN